MEKETRILPVAASSSSGFGGVAARFSILDEAGARQAGVAGESDAPTPPAATQALRNGFERAAPALESLYAFNATLTDAARGNLEGALRLFQDLAAAKGPVDMLSIHAKYSGWQLRQFSQQLEDIQSAFVTLLTSMAALRKDGFLYRIERVRQV